MTEAPDVRYTIAAVAERSGLSVHTLRAWERRYGIPSPSRSEGRYRLYGLADLDLLRRMQAAIADGATASEAARRARASEAIVGAGPLSTAELRDQLLDACRVYDAETAGAALGRGLSALGAVGLIGEIVEPVLHRVGEDWAAGRVGIDVEHFASSIVRSHLGAVIHGMQRPRGRRALLACPQGELHDLPLICLSVRLLRSGWRTAVLGPDLPDANLVAGVRRHRPSLVCISVTDTQNIAAGMHAAAAARRAASSDARVLLGGQAIGTDATLPEGVEGSQALRELVASVAGG